MKKIYQKENNLSINFEDVSKIMFLKKEDSICILIWENITKDTEIIRIRHILKVANPEEKSIENLLKDKEEEFSKFVELDYIDVFEV